jgi:uncharacterized DUF497 family protein
MPEFEWDQNKTRLNKSKHGLSFELASRVWDDPWHVILPENTYGGEERWLAIGSIGGITVIVVVHTYRLKHRGEVVRIISARKATPNERKLYEQSTTFR